MENKTECKSETDEIRNLSELKNVQSRIRFGEQFYMRDLFGRLGVGDLVRSLSMLPLNFRLGLLSLSSMELFKWKQKIITSCSRSNS